jgi:hypothetical protein
VVVVVVDLYLALAVAIQTEVVLLAVVAGAELV